MEEGSFTNKRLEDETMSKLLELPLPKASTAGASIASKYMEQITPSEQMGLRQLKEDPDDEED